MKNSVKKVLPKYFLSLFVCLIISANIFSASFVPDKIYSLKTIESEDDRIKRLFLSSANLEYNRSNWKEAKYAFYNYLLLEDETSPQRLEALYFYAKSCLNASDYFSAIEAYTEYLAQCNEVDRKIVAEWDRAIAAIKVDKNLAQKLLGYIAYDQGNKYHKEAKELIRLL